MNKQNAKTSGMKGLGALVGLALALGASGCSMWQQISQGPKQVLINKAGSQATATTSKAVNGPAAAPASQSLASNSAAPQTTPQVPGAAPAAMGAPAGMPNLGYDIITTPEAKALAASPACKGAKDGACASWAAAAQASAANAICMASCVAAVCGQPPMSQYYAAQAKGMGVDCSAGH